MLKYLLSFILLFSCFISNAQDEYSSKAITMSISLENNLQLFSNSVENIQFNPLGNLSKFSDGSKRNLVIGYGSKKFLENDNYQAWGIFGSGSQWERNDVFDLQDSLGNTIDEVRFLIGEVQNFTIGLRYTYGVALTHDDNLNFLIGFRGELHEEYYSALATEGVGFDTNANTISIRTFALPEVQYIIPNTRYIMSLRMGLPISSFGFDFQNVKNPALTLRQQRNGGLSFDLFGFKDTLYELSFGYFLVSK